MKQLSFFFLAILPLLGSAQPKPNPLLSRMDALADAGRQRVIDWRHDFHAHPELGNREFKTSAKIAEYLKSLGMDVQTGVAHTGVVAILKGGKPGPVVALRADIDALPITERADLPFASKETTVYQDKSTGVMHACGHDTHIAMLMGTAEVLSAVRKDLKGTVKFIFQPCEEGPPTGEEGGAQLMVKEGVLDNPKVDVIFGQHIASGLETGRFTYRSGSVSAENDIFRITIKGKQSHGAAPWTGVDPIVTASQVVMALQTIISRNMPLPLNAAVVTVGSIHAGNRENIIPEEAVLTGTIRTLDTTMRNTIHRRMREVVEHIAASAGATAEVKISMEDAMLVNDAALTEAMSPTLSAIAGHDRVSTVPAGMGAEDFAYFARKVPGFYFSTGAQPKGKEASDVLHHTPDFLVDESSFLYGVKALCHLTVDYMETHAPSR